MYDKIWSYISTCYDSGFLPHEDEVYTAFQINFDNGLHFDFAEEVVNDFISCSDLEGVEIRWEGELSDEIRDKGIGRIAKVS